ncbi:phage portal protein [Paenibacillus macerans]|uniref:phage portal protein n=1 Tax=Paenibacillus macerans TaxID=44252 RepID=UPI003D322DF4
MKRQGFVRRILNFGRTEQRSVEEIGLHDRRLLEFLGLDVPPGTINTNGWNALKIDTVFACVRVLSDAISKLPLKIYQEDENGVGKAVNHYLYSLLKLRPNPYMSASDFWKCMEAQRSFGNAYANIEFDPRTGRVVALWPIDANKVKVIVDDANIINSETKLWYEVDIGGQKRKIPVHEMLHFKGSITLDGLIGIRPLDYLRLTVENAGAAASFVNNFFKQGLQTKGLIQYTGTMDEPAKKVFRDNFESMSSGLKNSHRISLLPIGYTYIPMSLSMADAQFLEINQLSIRQIANLFGVKMHQLNDLSQGTFNNVEQMQLSFYSETTQAILVGYEQELTFKLFLDREIAVGIYTKFNVDSILRTDLKTRYEAYRTAIQGGFLAPNEARRREDMPALPGGDRLYANGNFIPLEMAGMQYKRG